MTKYNPDGLAKGVVKTASVVERLPKSEEVCKADESASLEMHITSCLAWGMKCSQGKRREVPSSGLICMLQKRLVSSVLSCGKIWLDPDEIANSN
ncbi:hypothetical protein J4Q44_G00035790 [Coregonus suidteri]|uniref:Ribosomal protein L19e N-terminal domain-containing protein n=1 Tax=Coregonus suidteri TaxID=861788 RepID=A0AAN8R8C0_9TELE